MPRIPLWKLIAIALAAAALLSGCVSTRTVLIPPGEPVQLAEPVRAYVYVDVDGQRIRSESPVTLPEGWWCLPDPMEGHEQSSLPANKLALAYRNDQGINPVVGHGAIDLLGAVHEVHGESLRPPKRAQGVGV